MGRRVVDIPPLLQPVLDGQTVYPAKLPQVICDEGYGKASGMGGNEEVHGAYGLTEAFQLGPDSSIMAGREIVVGGYLER
jgi:hypothetical protein